MSPVTAMQARRATVAILALSLLAGFAPVASKQQRLRELQRVVTRAADILPEPIEAIEAAADDVYRIRSARCVLEVRLVDARPAARAVHSPGGRRFRIAAGTPECRS